MPAPQFFFLFWLQHTSRRENMKLTDEPMVVYPAASGNFVMVVQQPLKLAKQCQIP
jgi:hypothetical protein